MNEIIGFTFFSSYYECLKDLDGEDRRDLLEAIVEFIFNDKEPEFNGIKRSIWILMKPNLTTSKNKSKNAKKVSKENQKKIKSKSKTKQKEISDLHDKEKDMEMDKEEKEKEDIILTNNTIYSYLEENFARTISPTEYEKLNLWLEEFNEEIVKKAIKECVFNHVKTFKYLEGILNNWKASGFKTIADINENEEKLNKRKHSHKEIPQELFDYNWLEDDNDE